MPVMSTRAGFWSHYTSLTLWLSITWFLSAFWPIHHGLDDDSNLKSPWFCTNIMHLKEPPRTSTAVSSSINKSNSSEFRKKKYSAEQSCSGIKWSVRPSSKERCKKPDSCSKVPWESAIWRILEVWSPLCPAWAWKGAVWINPESCWR